MFSRLSHLITFLSHRYHIPYNIYYTSLRYHVPTKFTPRLGNTGFCLVTSVRRRTQQSGSAKNVPKCCFGEERYPQIFGRETMRMWLRCIDIYKVSTAGIGVMLTNVDGIAAVVIEECIRLGDTVVVVCVGVGEGFEGFVGRDAVKATGHEVA